MADGVQEMIREQVDHIGNLAMEKVGNFIGALLNNLLGGGGGSRSGDAVLGLGGPQLASSGSSAPIITPQTPITPPVVSKAESISMAQTVASQLPENTKAELDSVKAEFAQLASTLGAGIKSLSAGMANTMQVMGGNDYGSLAPLNTPVIASVARGQGAALG